VDNPPLPPVDCGAESCGLECGFKCGVSFVERPCVIPDPFPLWKIACFTQLCYSIDRSVLRRETVMETAIRNQDGEREAVRRLVRELSYKGFVITHVDDGGVKVPVHSLRHVEEVVFSVDVSTLIVFSDRRDKRRNHQIAIILGNAEDGSEVVADWSYAPGDPDGFNAAMESLL
jgi:hypothetical protein